MTERFNWRVFFVGLSFFLVFAIGAFGQATTDITGTVTDPSGAVIPNAKVTMTNSSTKVASSSTSNTSGVYRVSNLIPGTYTLKVEAKGFKTSEQTGVDLSAGVVNRTDISLQLGQEVQTVTVEAGAQLVSTEEAKLQNTVRSEQIQNLALNGRNVFDLIKLAPGAVNVQGVMMENGAGTVVNGLRENFNGFILDGVSNKGLSGGFVTQPNQDIVAEFTVNTLSVSAQYGSSAGSITNMVTKSGSNDFHGDVYEYLRNDKFDATDFFTNQGGAKKTPLRFNQFGGSFGGPIRKDKTFFFGSFQSDHTIAANQPSPVQIESAQWRSAVAAALPGSVSGLIYNNFPYAGPITSTINSVSDYVDGTYGNFDTLLCPSGGANGSISDFFGGSASQTTPISNQFQALFGVTAAEATACPGLVAGQTATQLANRSLPFEQTGIASFKVQSVGNLFTGTEWSARVDHNINESNRLFGDFYYEHQKDSTGPTAVALVRGFKNPFTGDFPHAALSWTRMLSPTMVNEAKAGFLRNSTNVSVPVSQAGVPYIYFGTGEAPFGAYNGYPQFFHENIYTFSDLLSITHGKHSLKTGFDVARNQENSEFNVARPSYYFFDPLFFAADTPAAVAAGVDPGIISGQPAQLADNVRSWRNIDWGAYFQDDWKVSPHFTLNLGIRYDVYSRHHEKYGRMTQFVFGSGANVTEQMRNANIPAGAPGCDTPTQIATAQLAGVCGQGGFAAANVVGSPDHNNFSPRFGFAWDPKGNGSMAIRGGFGVSYEGTLYNPLSNSRWNLPFYSFDAASNFLLGDVGYVVYGPTVGTPGNYTQCTTASPQPVGCAAPTYQGDPTNVGQGFGTQAVGNIDGWDAANANFANLTAIVPEQNFKDPYVYNWFLGVQKQLNRSTGFEINYVGTAGHKLFRAQNVNRNSGGRLPIPGSCASDYGSPAGASVCSNLGPFNPAGRTNPNYGTMRFWNNSTNSIYNALQLGITRRMSGGFAINSNYTWGHSIDGGSDWHSGATSANGSAAGDAYSFDVANQSLDRGNSTFDIRHRFVLNYVWEVPWYKSQTGFAGHVLGGWSTSGLWSFQSGAHWTAYSSAGRTLRCFIGGVDSGSANTSGGASGCLASGGDIINTGGDWNLDGLGNDRPNAPNGNTLTGSKDQYANGYTVPSGFSHFNTRETNGQIDPGFFGIPCLGCDGTLGRNTFQGPNQFTTDISLMKKTNLSERVNLLFRADFFNAFNRTNFKMPSSSTGANFANRITSGIFGASAGVFDPREIQFSLKLSF